MKKINMKHDNKDRIICVSEEGKHKLYYQPVNTKKRQWLFDTKTFSGSVFAFFRKYGRCLDGVGFSMTIKELYEIGNNRNEKIAKLLNRIPAQVDYVLSENEKETYLSGIETYECYPKYDFDRAA